MKQVISLILIYCVLITSAFGQSVNPNDQLKIGKGASSTDKGIVFDTNDGASNKKLLIEKISKKLKFDGNAVQIGDGSPTSDKEIIVAGALKSLKYNGTSGEFEFDDDLKLSGELKSDILRAINTEVAVKSLLRAELGIKIGTGAHEIRVSGGNLEFSNDGSLYKKLGSGTGSGGSGGVNLVTNDSFEDGIGSPWTSSGGTFSQETYAVGFEGNTKYARLIASGAGQYVEQIVSVPTSLGVGCQADFKKVNVSTAGLFKVQALDASNNVLAEQTIGVSSWVKVPTISFPCPSAGSNNLKLRMTSIGAGTIDFDLGYIGSNQNLVNVSQAMLVFKGNFPLVAGCSVSRDSATLGAFSSVSACPAISPEFSSGGVTPVLTDFDKPTKFTLNNLKSGYYKITFFGAEAYTSGGNTSGRFAINDGVTTSPMGYATNTTSVSVGMNFSAVFYYNSFQSSKTFELFGADDLSPIQMLSTTATAMNVMVEYYPTDLETAVSNEQSSWFIDANIGGQNPNLGTGSVSSYTEIAGTTLDLVVNASKGSASAEIPCASGTASTGLTCTSVNESLGIAFIPPHAGLFEACFSFTHNANSTNGGTSYFQIVETSNTALTILSEGGQRIGAGHGNSISTINGQKVCGRFNFSDTSKKTLRLYYEQNVSSGTAFSILADRSANDGQRDIHVSVVPVLQPHSRPILTGDQVTRPGSSNIVEYDFVVDSAGGVSNLYGGNLVSSCTNASPHVCTFNAGKFIGQVECFVNIKTAGTYSGQAHTTSSSGTSISAWNSTTGSSVNSISSKAVRCVGQRP